MLPFGRLLYGKPRYNHQRNQLREVLPPLKYAVIRVYDEAGKVIVTYASRQPPFALTI